MAYAVGMNVKLGQSSPEEGLAMLRDMVVPHAKSQPGFQNGTWMNADGDGLGVVVFDTREHAEAALDVLKPPPGGPTLLSAKVYEVGAQA
ncbi:MAG: hypothetical protein NVSMB55_13110 [Mycobacteriales bacterium]